MNFFILQTLILLLLSFICGLVLAKFIKRRLCSRAALKAGAAQSVHLDAAIETNYLQIIEGIGPKMEAVLNENGVVTWSQLAARTVPELQDILDKYGNKYQIIDPAPWLEQARLAAAGKVEDLIKLQKIDGVSKLENLLYKDQKSGFARYSQDDLKIVEGIGPKIEVLLNNAGIQTWRALSQAQLSAIKKILRAAGPKYRLAVPESWMLQAKLADSGEWERLKQCQDKLRDTRSIRTVRQTAEAV